MNTEFKKVTRKPGILAKQHWDNFTVVRADGINQHGVAGDYECTDDPPILVGNQPHTWIESREHFEEVYLGIKPKRPLAPGARSRSGVVVAQPATATVVSGPRSGIVPGRSSSGSVPTRSSGPVVARPAVRTAPSVPRRP